MMGKKTGQVGRPKGSTNKVKMATQSLLQNGHGVQKKKGSGRPPKILDAKKRKKKENHVKRPICFGWLERASIIRFCWPKF